MSVYSEMAPLVQEWARRLDSRYRTYGDGVRWWAEGSAEFWRRMTSGTITARQLRKLGHPFGRGSSPLGRELGQRTMRGATASAARDVIGRRNVPKLPINVQSGRLRRSIAAVRVGQDSWSVRASTPYARHILNPLGTRLMVGRGFVTGRLIGGSPTSLGLTEVYSRRLLRELRRKITGV